MATTAPHTPDPVRAAWDDVAPGFDRLATPHAIAFGEQALAAVELGPGTRVLDVGCGTGALAIPAARRGADVLAVDLAPAMAARLRARAAAEGLDRLRTRVMDARALALADGEVDVAVSMNGVSIVGDLAGGLRELVRVTRPGGRVLVAAYGPAHRAEFLDYLGGAVRAVAPTPDAFTAPTAPFRLADRRVFADALAHAGATNVRVDAVTWPMPFASARHFWDVVTRCNPTGARLAASLTDRRAHEVRQVLDGMFRERSGGTPGVVLHAEVNVGTGTA